MIFKKLIMLLKKIYKCLMKHISAKSIFFMLLLCKCYCKSGISFNSKY